MSPFSSLGDGSAAVPMGVGGGLCYVVTIAAINHALGKQIINNVVTVTARYGFGLCQGGVGIKF